MSYISLKGKNTEERIWNYLIDKIGNSYGVSGLMGNLYAESGLIFNRVEILCLKRLKEHGKIYTDESYTAAIDSGKISCSEFLNPLPEKQYGFGLWQITSPSRKAGLYNLCKQRGVSIADEQTQLDYLMYELEHYYSSVLNVLKTTKSIREASDIVLRKFEIPSGINEEMCKLRASYGQKYYDKYATTKGDTIMSNKSEIIKNVINDAVTFAVGIANDNSHGYSQAVRSLYNITNPKSFDCSSLVLTAFYYAFMKNGLTDQANYLKSHCSYTGNMLSMTNCGFEIVAKNQTAHAEMVKGDIELNTIHHVVLAIDKDNIVHARSSEGTTDTKDGSGNEIRTQAWYQYSKGWTHRLRFTGKGIDFSKAKVTSSSSTKTENNTTKTDVALKVDNAISGTYKATTDVYMKYGASKNKGAICVIPNNGIVNCYGYYNISLDDNRTKWLYCQATVNGKLYTGYVSTKYLKRS